MNRLAQARVSAAPALNFGLEHSLLRVHPAHCRVFGSSPGLRLLGPDSSPHHESPSQSQCLRRLADVPTGQNHPQLRTGLCINILFEERVSWLWVFPSTSGPAYPVPVFERRICTFGIEKCCQSVTYELSLFCLLTTGLLIIRCMWPQRLPPGTIRPRTLPGDTALL